MDVAVLSQAIAWRRADDKTLFDVHSSLMVILQTTKTAACYYPEVLSATLSASAALRVR